MQPSFFDLDNRYHKLNERDALLWLERLILWEDFRETLDKGRDKKRKSAAGRKPFDAVMMFKALVLQHLYNLSDDELEFQIREGLPHEVLWAPLQLLPFSGTQFREPRTRHQDDLAVPGTAHREETHQATL